MQKHSCRVNPFFNSCRAVEWDSAREEVSVTSTHFCGRAGKPRKILQSGEPTTRGRIEPGSSELSATPACWVWWKFWVFRFWLLAQLLVTLTLRCKKVHFALSSLHFTVKFTRLRCVLFSSVYSKTQYRSYVSTYIQATIRALLSTTVQYDLILLPGLRSHFFTVCVIKLTDNNCIIQTYKTVRCVWCM
jgi:hypothetical protein